MTERDRWWGTYELDDGDCLRWRIGALSLVVCRAENEWRLVHGSDETSVDEEPDWEVAEAPLGLGEQGEEAARHVFRNPGRRLSLLPALADRPVVTSPRMPLFLAPGQEATLFVGSPLWVVVDTLDPAHRLAELPIRRPSDTWFGASTLEGEMCYAAKTRAVLDSANLPRTSRQAVTPVLIRNQAADALQVEALKIPVPFLSLYESSRGQLLTDGVTLVRTEDSELAQVEIQKERAPRSGSARLLTHAREDADDGLLTRAFSGLFHL